MLIKLYGLLDLTSGILLLLLNWGIGQKLAFVLAAYLIIKSLFYLKDIASIIDLMSGMAIIIAGLGFYHILFYVFALWLFQKGISSIFFT